MARRPLLLALVLGALAAGAMLLAVASGERATPPPITAGSTEVEAVGPTPDLLVSDGESGAVDVDSGDDVTDAAAARIAVADDRPSGPTLRIVEAATRRPLPGAEVFVADVSVIRGRDRGEGHWSDRVVAGVTPEIADAEGTVRLAPIRNGVLVVARAERLFGFGWFDQRTPPVAELALEPDQTLQVRVVDHGGRACPGVRVVLCADLPDRLERPSRATTGDDGIAVFTHVQTRRRKLPPRHDELEARLRELNAARAGIEQAAVATGLSREQRRASWQQRQALQVQIRDAERQLREQQRADRERYRGDGRDLLPDADFLVLAEVPARDSPVLRVPAAAIPEQPLELRIGTVGSLVVRLRGPGGEPVSSPCRVVVRASRDTPLPAMFGAGQADSARDLLRQSADKPLGADEVRLAPIGAGLRLDIAVEFADDDFDFAETDVAGPVGTEECVVELTAPGTWTVVAGRFVAGDGSPLPALRTQLFVAGTAGRIEGEPVVAGADGRFELPLRLRRPSPPYTLEVQATRGDERLGALVPIADLQVGARHDLGDVRVSGLPVLAFGVVRDDRGQPIPGASVTLQTLRTDRGKPAWRDEIFVRASTDEAGRYRLFGESRAGPLQLHARARGHASADVQIAFGAERDLTLDRLGSLTGSGLLPEWMPRDAVRLRLFVGRERVQDQALRARGGGRFEFSVRGLRAGVYTAVLELRGLPRPLLRVDGVVVPHGETVADPRLQDVDLRSVLFRYTITAIDQNGAPARGGNAPLMARLTDTEGQVRSVGFPWRGDRVEFISNDPSVEVVALSTGYRPTRAVVHPGDNRLILRRLHPVEVVLPGLREMVGAERSVRISLVFTGDTGLPMGDFAALDQWNGNSRTYPRASLGKSGGAWLGDSGDRVQVPLMLNGDYQIIARIREPAGGAQASVVLDTMPVVLDGAAPPRLVVTVPLEAIQAALADLQRQQAAPPGRPRGRR